MNGLIYSYSIILILGLISFCLKKNLKLNYIRLYIIFASYKLDSKLQWKISKPHNIFFWDKSEPHNVIITYNSWTWQSTDVESAKITKQFGM